MNLYIINNDAENRPNWDYYARILVAAVDEQQAFSIRPENPMNYRDDHWPPNAAFLSIQKIGICDPDRPAGMIMGDFINS